MHVANRVAVVISHLAALDFHVAEIALRHGDRAPRLVAIGVSEILIGDGLQRMAPFGLDVFLVAHAAVIADAAADADRQPACFAKMIEAGSHAILSHDDCLGCVQVVRLF